MVAIVMPAYNSSKTVQRTIAAIPDGIAHKIILVDDGSTDDTCVTARRLGIEVVAHNHNGGYGANQKSCHEIALYLGADIVVMLHPDDQYDPGELPSLISPLVSGDADLVLGSRMSALGRGRRGNMPWWRRWANRFLTTVENLCWTMHLRDAHTGYRAYTRDFLQTIPWRRNSSGFVFDSQILFQAAAFGQRVVEVPVVARYAPESSSISFARSVEYGLRTLWVCLLFLLLRGRAFTARIFRS